MGLPRNKTPKRRVKAKLREDRTVALQVNETWAMDFVHDQLATGRKIRILTVVDTYSRFSPAVDPRFSYRGEDVLTLERICGNVGYPPMGRALIVLTTGAPLRDCPTGGAPLCLRVGRRARCARPWPFTCPTISPGTASRTAVSRPAGAPRGPRASPLVLPRVCLRPMQRFPSCPRHRSLQMATCAVCELVAAVTCCDLKGVQVASIALSTE
jgi:hypothetical protein